MSAAPLPRRTPSSRSPSAGRGARVREGGAGQLAVPAGAWCRSAICGPAGSKRAGAVSKHTLPGSGLGDCAGLPSNQTAPPVATCATALGRVWAWTARASSCDAGHSFLAARAAKGAREAFL